MFSDVNPFALMGVVAMMLASGFIFSCLADLAGWLVSLVARSE